LERRLGRLYFRLQRDRGAGPTSDGSAAPAEAAPAAHEAAS
jgi:hypothetical protein